MNHHKNLKEDVCLPIQFSHFQYVQFPSNSLFHFRLGCSRYCVPGSTSGISIKFYYMLKMSKHRRDKFDDQLGKIIITFSGLLLVCSMDEYRLVITVVKEGLEKLISHEYVIKNDHNRKTCANFYAVKTSSSSKRNIYI